MRFIKKNKNTKQIAIGGSRKANLTGKRMPSGTPIMRYYRPSNLSTPAKETSANRFNEPKDKDRFFRRRINSLIRSIYRWLGVLVLVFILFANTTLDGNIALKIDTTDLYSYRSVNEYSQVINSLFNEDFKNHSKLLFNSEKFEEKIINELPEVEKAVAIVPLAGRQLQVGMKIAKPLVRLQSDDNTRNYYLSTSGIIIEIKSPGITSIDRQLPLLSVPNMKFEDKNALLTSEEVSLISLLIKEFDGSEPYRYKIDSLEYDIEKREFKVRFEGQNFYAKLTPERESRGQVGSLVATLKSFMAENKMPSEYIDVRVEDRVFVR